MSLPNTPPRRKYRYVTDKQTFEEIGDGTVRVTDDDGRSGVFTWQGQFIEGELTTVNENMLIWTGGPDIPKEFNYRWINVPPDITRPSGWPEERERTVHNYAKRP